MGENLYEKYLKYGFVAVEAFSFGQNLWCSVPYCLQTTQCEQVRYVNELSLKGKPKYLLKETINYNPAIVGTTSLPSLSSLNIQEW